MNNTKKINLIIIILLVINSCLPENKKENYEGHKNKHTNMLILSDKDRLLADIRIEIAAIKNISETTTLVGKTAIDERGVNLITAHVKGRLDKLFIKNPGAYVKQGQVMYSIYSEELLADENDYLMAIKQMESAIEQKDIARLLLEAARKKLLLWTLTPAQIKEIENSKSGSSLIKFYSPYTGYVLNLPVREGEYVDVGSPIMKIADLSKLWIETQVYSDEIKYLKQSPVFLAEFEAYPNEIYKSTVVFDNPIIEEDQKVNLVRLQVNNTDNKLKPGMMAYLYLQRNEKKALVILKSALLLESTTSVWLEDSDGMFEQRMVVTGIENKKEIEIISGIKPGEKVVISGAFFLKSESVIRQGGGNMGGMKM
ncbi:MAG: efflux RND transporter periplasmic adaptor subunit [Bacteroidia bacterium]|nr:efflux RND transporter periplasmic adaptor subunit [Bacteroidia bacterium]